MSLFFVVRTAATKAKSRFLGKIAEFRQRREGVAAVEFALMVPAMMSIWIGMVVATDALTADKKVTLLARTLADLTTQTQAVSQADMDSIFLATESVLWPQSAQRVGMRVISLDIDGTGQVFVDWSVVPSDSKLRGTFSPLVRCTLYTALPAGLVINRTSIVYAEVAMSYQASVATELVDQLFKGTAVNGALPLADNLYMRPRQSTKVSFSPAPTSACPGYVP